jgi:hypothetical protein
VRERERGMEMKVGREREGASFLREKKHSQFI